MNPNNQTTRRSSETTSPWTEPFRTSYDNQADSSDAQRPASQREHQPQQTQRALTDIYYSPNR